jgi:hypothetical protein
MTMAHGRNRHSTKPSPKPRSPWDVSPPFLTYDPGLQAQRRAAQRGLEDTESDVKTKRHFAHKDLTEALRDVRVSSQRGRQKITTAGARGREDIGRSSQRSEAKFGLREGDVRKRAQRANEDFDTQLKELSRRFATLGRSQGEAASAAGVADQGTLRASASVRQQNKRIAEAPIGVARRRTGEDLADSLARINTERGWLGEDTGREQGRLGQDEARELGELGEDVGRERGQARRQYGREGFELKRERERARREANISNVDLLAQEIYQARAEHPAVFSHWKQTHPEAIKRAEERGKRNEPGGRRRRKR